MTTKNIKHKKTIEDFVSLMGSIYNSDRIQCTNCPFSDMCITANILLCKVTSDDIIEDRIPNLNILNN